MSPLIPKPSPDLAGILAALDALFEPSDVIELRAFHKGRKIIVSGYFDGDHREAFADEAVRLNKAGAAVYVTLNRLDPQLLSRYANRVAEYANKTTTDADVIRRRWLLVDFDPKRPADTPATDEQLEAARQRAKACAGFLREQGWPEPLKACSGNGWHLLYPLDLPNDKESADLVKNALAGLAERFDDVVVSVDPAVFNAARITKLYGTVATKGDHTRLAPWRLSKLTRGRGVSVSADQLRAIGPSKTGSPPPGIRAGGGEFDIAEFLLRLGISYQEDLHRGRRRFKLDHCPFNPEHGKGEAAIFVGPDGKLGFKCQHASCADKRWEDLRELIDGPSARQSGGGLGSIQPEPAAQDDQEWPEPQPLIVKGVSGAYPMDKLPDGISAAVAEVVGFVQCPTALAACSALSNLSLVGQGLIDARRAEGLEGPCSLYFLSIADSGERKSTCDSFFAKPIRAWEAEQAERSKPELARYKADLRVWKAKVEGLEAALKRLAKLPGKSTDEIARQLRELVESEPEQPKFPNLLYSDSTPEALAWSLAKDWPSGAILSSEAGVVFGSHGMNPESAMRNMSLLNALWDGGSVKVNRRTSANFVVEDVRLTVGLAVQPDTIRAFFESTKGLARGIGFAARFLIAWPESTQGERLYRESPGQFLKVEAYSRRMVEMLALQTTLEQGQLPRKMLELSPAAKKLWVECYNDVEAELKRGGEMADIRDVASKAADNAARMAALFHLYENGPEGEISPLHLEMAAATVSWHLYEARRFLSEIALPRSVDNASKLDAWLLARCSEIGVQSISTRQVQQYGPGPVRERAALDAAINELAEAGRIRIISSGRSKLIIVNPALLGGDYAAA